MIQEKLNDGTTKKYVKGKLLGKGGFAKCYEVISLQTQKKYAAKVIEKAGLEKSKAKQKLTSQIKIHKSLNHQYVVKFQHYFEDSQFVYILLEKCSNQTLNQLLKRRKRLTEIETKYYVRQIALAVQYIHENHIIHRDLKLGNLFLSDKLQIKIGDFGLATKLTHPEQRKKTKCGTPNYIAPQILDDKKTHSFQVDIWSMGVITYALLVGKPPFQTNDVKNTYNKIKTCSYSFPDAANVSDSAKALISKMLQLDPCKRATIQQVLNDSFLYENAIPQFLPISSLACPPSYDFLKKYKDLQNNKATVKQIESIDKFQLIQPQNNDNEARFNSTCMSQQKKPTALKFNSRVSSIQKSLKSNNRVFSAANLLNQPKQMQIKKSKNELVHKSMNIWVTYMQQNPKYGLGYLLNSGACGFRFNDKTAIISNSKANMFKYFQTKQGLSLKDAEGVICKPSEIQKSENRKYRIVTHFHKTLTKTKVQTETQLPNQLRIRIQQKKHRETQQTMFKFYVIRYHKTNKATLIWFNNNALQVIFQDHSQLLVNSNVITYVNKLEQRHYFEQKDKNNQSQQIKRRLNYLWHCTNNIVVKKQKQNHTKQSEKQKNKQTSKDKTISRNNSTKGMNHCRSARQLQPRLNLHCNKM